MQYEEYVQRARHAAQLVEQKDFEEAMAVLQGLLFLDISPMDKAMMCLNLAQVMDQLGRTDEAVAWYDKGSEYEYRAGGTFVTERRAAYLAEKDRCRESLLGYQTLLGHPVLSDGDKHRIRHNIEILMGRLA